MAFDPITAAFDLGKIAIEKLFPDPSKRAEEIRKLEEVKQRGNLAELNAYVEIVKGQLEVNKAEAQHKSVFVAGWRPAVGWVCVAILAFNYIGIPLMEFAALTTDLIKEAPQNADMSDLWPVLMGMLGIGGMRSWEKRSGVQTDRLK